jgi:hypothetical protein
MQRKTLNLVLATTALSLGVAVYLGQKKEVKDPPLTPIAAADLSRVVIEHPGAATIKLEKIGGHWKLTAPVKADADPFETNAFSALATLEVKSSLEPAQVSLKELGLEPPAYSVTLNDQKLLFGGIELIQSRRYILSNNKVALVEDPPSAALDADYSDLLGKALLPAGAEIQSIALPGLSVAKSADGKAWSLTPDNANVGSDARQKLVDAWKNARAMWNAALPKDSAKGDEVTVTLKDNAALKFIITQRDPQFVIARPDLGVSYTLSKQLVDEMLKLSESAGDKKAVTPTPAAPSK